MRSYTTASPQLRLGGYHEYGSGGEVRRHTVGLTSRSLTPQIQARPRVTESISAPRTLLRPATPSDYASTRQPVVRADPATQTSLPTYRTSGPSRLFSYVSESAHARSSSYSATSSRLHSAPRAAAPVLNSSEIGRATAVQVGLPLPSPVPNGVPDWEQQLLSELRTRQERRAELERDVKELQDLLEQKSRSQQVAVLTERIARAEREKQLTAEIKKEIEVREAVERERDELERQRLRHLEEMLRMEQEKTNHVLQEREVLLQRMSNTPKAEERDLPLRAFSPSPAPPAERFSVRKALESTSPVLPLSPERGPPSHFQESVNRLSGFGPPLDLRGNISPPDVRPAGIRSASLTLSYPRTALTPSPSPLTSLAPPLTELVIRDSQSNAPLVPGTVSERISPKPPLAPTSYQPRISSQPRPGSTSSSSSTPLHNSHYGVLAGTSRRGVPAAVPRPSEYRRGQTIHSVSAKMMGNNNAFPYSDTALRPSRNRGNASTPSSISESDCSLTSSVVGFTWNIEQYKAQSRGLSRGTPDGALDGRYRTTEDNAAAKIQSLFRGYLTRRKRMHKTDSMGSSQHSQYSQNSRLSNSASSSSYLVSNISRESPVTVHSVRIVGQLVAGHRLTARPVISDEHKIFKAHCHWYTIHPSETPLYASRKKLLLSFSETVQLTAAEVGYLLAVEYTPVDRAGVSGNTLIAFSDMPVQPGDGRPSVELLGTPAEGQILVASVQNVPPEILQHGRFFWSNGIAMVETDKLQYRIQRDDIGRRITFMYTPLPYPENPRPLAVSATTDIVQPAPHSQSSSPAHYISGYPGYPLQAFQPLQSNEPPPTIENLVILGDLAVGCTLTMSYSYSGGTEGESLTKWQSVTDAGELETLVQHSKTIVLSAKELGRYIRVSVLPISRAGIRGKPVSTTSRQKVVDSNCPEVISFDLLGTPVEGSTLTAVVNTEYFGKRPGVGFFHWYRDRELVQSSVSPDYVCTSLDVGKVISFQYTPVNGNGVTGAMVTRNTPPIRSLASTRAPPQTLTSSSSSGSPSPSYLPTPVISSSAFQAASSSSSSSSSSSPIAAFPSLAIIPPPPEPSISPHPDDASAALALQGIPEIRNLRFPHTHCGRHITADYEFLNNAEGNTVFLWQRSRNREDWIILECKSKTYVSNPDDLHHYLKCTVTPVAVDGKVGLAQTVEGFCTLTTKYRDELRKVLRDGVKGFNLKDSEDGKIQILMSSTHYRIIAAIQDHPKLIAKQKWHRNAAVHFLPETDTELAILVPKAASNPTNKRFVFTIARRDARDFFGLVFRLFHALANREAVVPPLSSMAYTEWKKGNFAAFLSLLPRPNATSTPSQNNLALTEKEKMAQEVVMREVGNSLFLARLTLTAVLED